MRGWIRCIYNLLLLVLSFSFSQLVFASNTVTDTSVKLHAVTVEPRISYEQYHMPNSTQPLGVVGLHGLVDFNNWFYGGLGFYGAVRGQSGGYFALALEGGLQHRLWRQVLIDGGARVGGGGGSNSPVGGGLYYEPYLGLKYDFNYFRTGLYYSYIHFVYGQITSQQLGLELTVPFTFNYATATYIDPSMRFVDLNTSLWKYIGSSRNSIAAMIGAYFPNDGVIERSGQVMDSRFDFLGIEATHYFLEKGFLFFKIRGAFHGHQNGYADAMLGLGYRFPLIREKLDALIKMSAGSGGGGAVDTGGGFIYEPALGIEYHVGPKLGVELNAGYVNAPQGTFKAKEMSLLFKYYLSNANLASSSSQTSNMQISDHGYFQAWRIRLLNQTYLTPRSNSGTDNPTMQLLNVNLDYFIQKYFYLTGQTAFAYKGKQTGGYFTGMLGIGGETPTILHKPITLFTEILVGTGGGAGLDIGDGAMVNPLVGINYQVNDAFGSQVSIGRLIALQGQFQSTNFNLGLTYKLWNIT